MINLVDGCRKVWETNLEVHGVSFTKAFPELMYDLLGTAVEQVKVTDFLASEHRAGDRTMESEESNQPSYQHGLHILHTSTFRLRIS